MKETLTTQLNAKFGKKVAIVYDAEYPEELILKVFNNRGVQKDELIIKTSEFVSKLKILEALASLRKNSN